MKSNLSKRKQNKNTIRVTKGIDDLAIEAEMKQVDTDGYSGVPVYS
jgi:hypothetical protein